jgi:hypothetical protein
VGERARVRGKKEVKDEEVNVAWWGVKVKMPVWP